MTRQTLAFALAASVGLLACGSDTETPGTTPSELANPASEFCVEQGGSVEIVSEAGGEVGYCNLPDGTRIEEWEYFRSQVPTATATP
jgi:putative hemolysin